MKIYGYHRLDPSKFGDEFHNIDIKDAKKIIDKKMKEKYHVNQIIDEDIKSDKSGIKDLFRPELTKLIGCKLPEDPSVVPATGAMMKDGDVLYVYNLSHLSANPAIIGKLVHLILNGSGRHKHHFILRVISTGMSSDNPDHVHFFEGLMGWRHTKTSTSINQDDGGGDGGDGGGNGGM